jgi:hypothetical protein
MYEKEVNAFIDFASGLEKTTEIEKMDKRLKEARFYIEIASALPAGSLIFKQTCSIIDSLLIPALHRQAPAVKREPSAIVDDLFGTKDMVYSKTILLVSDKPIDTETLKIDGVKVFPKSIYKEVNAKWEGAIEIGRGTLKLDRAKITN